MINQNYLFHIFATENRSSNNKNIEYVAGSSAVPEDFFGIPGT